MLEYILICFLVINCFMGIRIHLDFKKFKRLREEITIIQQDIASYLEEVDGFVENFKRIYSNRSDILKELMGKADSTKEELNFIVLQAEQLLSKLRSETKTGIEKDSSSANSSTNLLMEDPVLTQRKIEIMRKIQEMR